MANYYPKIHWYHKERSDFGLMVRIDRRNELFVRGYRVRLECYDTKLYRACVQVCLDLWGSDAQGRHNDSWINGWPKNHIYFKSHDHMTQAMVFGKLQAA